MVKSPHLKVVSVINLETTSMDKPCLVYDVALKDVIMGRLIYIQNFTQHDFMTDTWSTQRETWEAGRELAQKLVKLLGCDAEETIIGA